VLSAYACAVCCIHGCGDSPAVPSPAPRGPSSVVPQAERQEGDEGELGGRRHRGRGDGQWLSFRALVDVVSVGGLQCGDERFENDWL
jgi:hypothetical protein